MNLYPYTQMINNDSMTPTIQPKDKLIYTDPKPPFKDGLYLISYPFNHRGATHTITQPMRLIFKESSVIMMHDNPIYEASTEELQGKELNSVTLIGTIVTNLTAIERAKRSRAWREERGL